MSTLQNTGRWSLSDKPLESKYEKCRNITEEIYKRINITFQIKQLEATQSDVSDHSDQIDSNDLSNETDLFACDKTDTISSSTEGEKPLATCEKYININNNEETKKKHDVVYKRPRKRFRKRVKKSQPQPRSESDGSSDEAPLSRIVELDAKCVRASHVQHSVMGVPNIVIVANLKPKLYTPEKKQPRNNTEKSTPKTIDNKPEVSTDDTKAIDKPEAADLSVKIEKCATEYKNCTLCSLSFRGERGLRRHMAMSHIVPPEASMSTTEQRYKAT